MAERRPSRGVDEGLLRPTPRPDGVMALDDTTAATAPPNPINRWPISTPRLTMLTPGMIRANANAAENSDSPSQARRSTTERCIQTYTPPPKLERPIRENNRKNSRRLNLGGRTRAASVTGWTLFLRSPRWDIDIHPHFSFH